MDWARKKYQMHLLVIMQAKNYSTERMQVDEELDACTISCLLKIELIKINISGLHSYTCSYS